MRRDDERWRDGEMGGEREREKRERRGDVRSKRQLSG